MFTCGQEPPGSALLGTVAGVHPLAREMVAPASETAHSVSTDGHLMFHGTCSMTNNTWHASDEAPTHRTSGRLADRRQVGSAFDGGVAGQQFVAGDLAHIFPHVLHMSHGD